jgi:surface antigen
VTASLATALVAALVVAAGPASGPASAQTTICSGVSTADTAKCDPGWAANMKFMHWRMYAGHNCTNYVAYRLGRDGVPEPSYLLGNANTWASRAKAHGVRVDNKPEVGAVGAWPGRNHVVYVEEVASGYLITSEDNYPGYYPKGMYRKIRVSVGESAYPTQFIHFKGKATINGPVPSVSGTPKVGSTLTATVGTWSPSDVKLTYQWLRDGVIISGATQTSYTLTSADVGHAMSISVTGTKSGLTTRTASSDLTDDVTAAKVKPGTPRIDGAEQMMVGDWLTVDPGDWAPEGVQLNYQWYRGDHAVSTGTTTRYKVSGADLGLAISVKVTGTLTGSGSASVTSQPTAPAKKAAITTSTTPTISGTRGTGQWLTGEPGSWGPSDVELAYQWFRDGKAVKGATGLGYKLTSADRGHSLTFRVTGTKDGLDPVTLTSPATSKIKIGPKLTVTAEGVKGGATVTVIVSASGQPTPTGSATASEGTKELKTLDLAIGRPGRATLRVKLSKGTHTLTVSYSGSKTLSSAKATVTVKAS